MKALYSFVIELSIVIQGDNAANPSPPAGGEGFALPFSFPAYSAVTNAPVL